jgi:hypothetical protein
MESRGVWSMLRYLDNRRRSFREEKGHHRSFCGAAHNKTLSFYIWKSFARDIHSNKTRNRSGLLFSGHQVSMLSKICSSTNEMRRRWAWTQGNHVQRTAIAMGSWIMGEEEGSLVMSSRQVFVWSQAQGSLCFNLSSICRWVFFARMT